MNDPLKKFTIFLVNFQTFDDMAFCFSTTTRNSFMKACTSLMLNFSEIGFVSYVVSIRKSILACTLAILVARQDLLAYFCQNKKYFLYGNKFMTFLHMPFQSYQIIQVRQSPTEKQKQTACGNIFLPCSSKPSTNHTLYERSDLS